MGKAKTAGLRVEPAVFGWLGSDLFLDLCSLAKTVAQIVQLRAANLAVADALDVDNVGRMERENLLAADTIGDAANGDGFFDTAVLLGDDGALEDLDSFAGTFLAFDMTANGVATLNFRQLLLHVLAGQSLHEIHTCVLLQIKNVHTARKCRCTFVPAAAEDHSFSQTNVF